MTFADFVTSLDAELAPAGLTANLKALWLDGKGDWDGAHDVVQDDDSKTSAWVHAYLHRKEGDIPNATYWYRRADRQLPAETLQVEWKLIVKTLLAGNA